MGVVTLPTMLSCPSPAFLTPGFFPHPSASVQMLLPMGSHLVSEPPELIVLVPFLLSNAFQEKLL